MAYAASSRTRQYAEFPWYKNEKNGSLDVGKAETFVYASEGKRKVSPCSQPQQQQQQQFLRVIPRRGSRLANKQCRRRPTKHQDAHGNIV